MVRFEAKIKAITEMLTTKHHYIYDSWQGINEALENLEKEDFPVVANILPFSGYLHVGNITIDDEPKCNIAFLRRASELDFVGDENENPVHLEKEAASEFIDLCNRSGWFEPIEDVAYQLVYDRLDENLTGIILDVYIREKVGTPLCPRTPIFPALRDIE